MKVELRLFDVNMEKKERKFVDKIEVMLGPEKRKTKRF